jgi:UDP-glucuronate 4-epimerase
VSDIESISKSIFISDSINDFYERESGFCKIGCLRKNRNSMKILVTGAAGFVGFHLVKKLLEKGVEVVGIDNVNNYYDVKLKFARLAETGIGKNAQQWYIPVQSSSSKNYTFIRMNLEDREQIIQLFEKESFDAVCNLAAQAGVRYSIENPHAYVSSNIIGFVNILEACRHTNVRHLVFASSSSVYGNSTQMPLRTNATVDNPISLYAATKKSNELMAFTYSHLFGLRTTGLRLFTVYGPWGRPDMAYFSFTKAILDDKPIQVFNNGNLYRDFTYINDITEGIQLILLRQPESARSEIRRPDVSGQLSQTSYKIYNIGHAEPVLLNDFISEIEQNLGKPAVKVNKPMQPGDVYRTEADVSDLMADYGYRPKTSLNEGIAEFVKWYKDYYQIPE